MHPKLKALINKDFLEKYIPINSIEGLYAALAGSSEIKELIEILNTEPMEEHITEFMTGLADNFKPGERFEYDITIAALVIAAGATNTDWRGDFLHEISTTTLVEIPATVKIAKFVRQLANFDDIIPNDPTV